MSHSSFQVTLKAFILYDQNVLVLKTSNTGMGDLPGGRLDIGEIYKPWTQALMREIREELGPHFECELSPEPIFLFPHYIQSARQEAIGLAFAGRYKKGEIYLSSEHVSYEWVDFKQNNVAEQFKDHLKNAVQTYFNKYPTGYSL